MGASLHDARRQRRPLIQPAALRSRLAPCVQWEEKHTSWNFDVRKGRIYAEWFKGGVTNICYNALDRHVLAGRGEGGGRARAALPQMRRRRRRRRHRCRRHPQQYWRSAISLPQATSPVSCGRETTLARTLK